jgi:hypothetical protein
MKMSLRAAILLPAVGMLAFTNISNAATPGSDNAGNAAYSDSWTTGDNGGTGFGAWTLTSIVPSGFAGSFIGDSTGVGSNINTSGVSFGMYGNPGGGNFQNNNRNFDGALSVGQTFSIQLAVNYRNGQKGIDLRDGSNATLFTFNVTGDDYVVSNAATGNGSIGNDYSSNSIFTLSFTQTSLGVGNWAIARTGGVTDSASGTYSGLANGFNLFVGNTDGGGAPQNNLYMNSMSITAVPEASSWGIMMGAFLALFVVYRVRTRARQS